MATIKLTLDKRRSKQNNSYPLLFRISLDGKSRDIPTGFCLKEPEWNAKSGTVSKAHPSREIVTARIKELESEYFCKIVEFDRLHSGIRDIQKLKDFITSKTVALEPVTVKSFWQQEIRYLHSVNRNGGATVYAESLAALDKITSLQIPFTEIDYEFLKQLETSLISRGVKINTVGIHFRTLRAVFNKAINAKLVSFEHYPFRSYRIRRESTTPKVLTVPELRAYFNLQLSPDSYLYDNWLLGKLMFMLIGINFKDMVLMKESQIHNGRFFYNRSKTGRPYSIKLVPHALEIVNYFKGKDNHTVLGQVKAEQLIDKEKIAIVMRRKNRDFNFHQREIGKMLLYKERIRGYYFRYSWANISKQLGYSKDMIAEALGHQYGNKVTGIYLEAYDRELLDEMNESVCRAIM